MMKCLICRFHLFSILLRHTKLIVYNSLNFNSHFHASHLHVASLAICEKLKLTISHQTNLNSLCENNREYRRCRAQYETSKQTAFNLPRNNLHFPVQRFRWEIYCEYACSTYEYEYEKIIMPTTVRDAGSSHAEKLFCLHLSCSATLSLFLFIFLLIFLLSRTRLFSKFSKSFTKRTNRKVIA